MDPTSVVQHRRLERRVRALESGAGFQVQRSTTDYLDIGWYDETHPYVLGGAGFGGMPLLSPMNAPEPGTTWNIGSFDWGYCTPSSLGGDPYDARNYGSFVCLQDGLYRFRQMFDYTGGSAGGSILVDADGQDAFVAGNSLYPMNVAHVVIRPNPMPYDSATRDSVVLTDTLPLLAGDVMDAGNIFNRCSTAININFVGLQVQKIG